MRSHVADSWHNGNNEHGPSLSYTFRIKFTIVRYPSVPHHTRYTPEMKELEADKLLLKIWTHNSKK